MFGISHRVIFPSLNPADDRFAFISIHLKNLYKNGYATNTKIAYKQQTSKFRHFVKQYYYIREGKMSRNHRSPRSPGFPLFRERTRQGYQIFFFFFFLFISGIYRKPESGIRRAALKFNYRSYQEEGKGRNRVDGEVVKMAVARSRK